VREGREERTRLRAAGRDGASQERGTSPRGCSGAAGHSSAPCPPAQRSDHTRLSLSDTQDGDAGPGASGKARPRPPTPSRSSPCLWMGAARCGGTARTSAWRGCQPRTSPWPCDAGARCHSARWPMPARSQTPAPRGPIHRSGRINKTRAQAAAVPPPGGCAALTDSLTGVGKASLLRLRPCGAKPTG